jgi:hypothetical protein
MKLSTLLMLIVAIAIGMFAVMPLIEHALNNLNRVMEAL